MKPFLLEPIPDYTIWEPIIFLKLEASMKTLGLGGKSVPTLIVQTKLLEPIKH